MIITDEATQRATARLAVNPDFKTFLQWLKDEESSGLEALLASTNTVLVHQLQGSTRLLMDIQAAVMHAPNAVADMVRSRNT